MFKKLIKIFNFGFVIGLSFLLVCPLANSADFPKKTIKIIACAAAGGERILKPVGLLPILKNI